MMWKGVIKAVMTTTTTTRPWSTVSENYFFSWSEAKENSRRRLISPKGLNKKKSVKSRNADEGNNERVVLIILTNLSKRKRKEIYPRLNIRKLANNKKGEVNITT
jgi:hypothetical protein